jgi:hypothetical protein
MRAIFTQWSAPSNNNIHEGDNYSGFPSFEIFLWSWVCSVTLAKKHFDQVELYCDTSAKQILVDQLQLPFDKVHITLDGKDKYKNIWAYGKIDTYIRQTEPFVHLDADLFLYKKLNKELEYPFFFWVEEGFVGQNIVYVKGYDQLSTLPYFPNILKENPVHNSDKIVVNVGLFYVKNPEKDAFQEYITTLKLFFEKNKHIIAQKTSTEYGCASVVIEQYLLYLILKKYNISYEAFKKIDTSLPSAFEIKKCPHFLSSTKVHHGYNIKQRAIMLTGKKYIDIINKIVKHSSEDVL